MRFNKILSVLLIGIISTMIFSTNVNAKSISTLEVKKNSDKLTVSGTTENGVLAVAVLVYSKDTLAHMETCSSKDNKYSCELNKTFGNGDYTVKVADYNGGDYITKNISLNESNPLTLDGILIYTGLGILSVLGLIGTGLYLKKRANS